MNPYENIDWTLNDLYDDTNKRKIAMGWWNKLYYIQKFEYIVKHKESILGYPDRNPDTLTGSEIEKIYNLEHK